LASWLCRLHRFWLYMADKKHVGILGSNFF
jgi:hypothetical protein